jgi:DNA-directed RNA polymerase subunit H (RpoH/RPB5)
MNQIIYKSRYNILNIMESQEYDVQEYSNFNNNEIEILTRNNQLDMLLKRNTTSNKPQNKIWIRYFMNKIKNQDIDNMIEDLFIISNTLSKDDVLFIIVKDPVNDSITNKLKQIWEKDKIFIVIQHITNLQFNILEHTLVPPHVILTNDEIETIKTKYNITCLKQFPKISRFDAVAQTICMRPGDVCEIIRPSKTSITSIYYRVCV